MIGPKWASNAGMEAPTTQTESVATKPICVGLTCWLWERGRPKAIVELAKRMGVTVELTQKVHGLHREIQAQVSGENVDRFIGEFVRHC
jgi:hypothetical protein